MSASPAEGLRSDALLQALDGALDGRTAPLEDLLGRYGRGPGARPNLRLGAAFGAEIAARVATARPNAIRRLLTHLGANDAAPDTPAVFLPVAAAYGWVAQLEAVRDVQPIWAALAALAGDERAPVRLGTLEALVAFAARPGNGATLLDEATGWLEIDDREQRFGAAAVVVEAFADRRVLSALGDPEPLLAFLSRVIAEAAGASRAAERSDARRRLLLALSRTLGAVVLGLPDGDRGPQWLEAECADARHPDVRVALSNAILGLAAKSTHAVVSQRLRQALEGSAKPPRDPTRRRPGAARGKATRRMR